MNYCLTQQLATTVLSEDRKRSQRPRVLVQSFANVASNDVQRWFQAQGVEVTKVARAQRGHLVTCESSADLQKLANLNGSQVEVAGTIETIRVQKLDSKMMSNDILDFVGNRLADEEIYNDSRRIAHQAAASAKPPQVNFDRRRHIHEIDVEEEEIEIAVVAKGTSAGSKEEPKDHPREGRGEGWPLSAQRQRGDAKGSSGKGTKGSSAEAGKGGGKGRTPTCWNCGEPGHMMFECSAKGGAAKGGRGKRSTSPREGPQP